MAAVVKIGVLAVQGAFAEHVYSIKKASDLILKPSSEGNEKGITIEVVEVRTCEDVVDLDGLVIPGGESTTMAKFMDRNGLMAHLVQWMAGHEGVRPCVWGTCAGLILLADQLEATKTGGQSKLGGLSVTTARNTYGRQRESFETNVNVHEKLGGSTNYHGVFIRAPSIQSIDREDVTVLASLETENGIRPVGVEQGPIMACSFHPELTDDLRWHSYFLQKVISSVVCGNVE